MQLDHSHTILELKNVSFSFPGNQHHQVLKDVSLSIHQGDFLGILGPNGGGKTTLVHILLGLLEPSVGEVFLFGQPLSSFKAWRKIAYVPQKATSFDAHFPVTVKEVVAMGRLMQHAWWQGSNEQDLQAIEEALKTVSLLPEKNTLIGKLSGGQQQRVFIARALAQAAEVLILDEPTTGVDQASQQSFYGLLRQLHTKGITIILISHEEDVVVAEATEIACVNQTLEYHGNSSDFIHSEYLTDASGSHSKKRHHHYD